MTYVCEAFEVINGIQTCVQWTEFSYLPSLAITQAQSIEISIAVAKICGLLMAYTFIMKAAKLA